MDRGNFLAKASKKYTFQQCWRNIFLQESATKNELIQKIMQNWWRTYFNCHNKIWDMTLIFVITPREQLYNEDFYNLTIA